VSVWKIKILVLLCENLFISGFWRVKYFLFLVLTSEFCFILRFSEWTFLFWQVKLTFYISFYWVNIFFLFLISEFFLIFRFAEYYIFYYGKMKEIFFSFLIIVKCFILTYISLAKIRNKIFNSSKREIKII